MLLCCQKSVQSYGFSSSHVWMWKLDHKESWAPKNWCFQIVVLEKTLKSSLDFKEIKSIHSISHVRLFATPWTAAHQAALFITNSQSLFKLVSIKSVVPSNHLILCHPLLLPPSIFSSIKVFSDESVLHIRWPKYWSFSFSISPSNEYSGLISLRRDWFDILAVQGTLKSLLQHHNLKTSVLWHSAFFRVQLSYLYMTTGKTIALTRWSFVGKVMSLLINTLSRFVIAFLLRSKSLYCWATWEALLITSQTQNTEHKIW